MSAGDGPVPFAGSRLLLPVDQLFSLAATLIHCSCRHKFRSAFSLTDRSHIHQYLLFPDSAYLTSNLAPWRDLCMHVRVSSAGADCSDDCGEVTSRKLLGCLRPGYHVCRCDHPTDGPLLWALRRQTRWIRTSRR